MEILVALAALIVLDLAANALGADPREAELAELTLEHERFRDHGWVGGDRSRR